MSAAVCVVLAAVAGGWAWRTAGRRRWGVGLEVYSQGAVCLVAAQVALVAHGVVRTVGLGVAGVLVAWMVGTRLGRGPVGRGAVGGAPTAATSRPGPVPRWRSFGRGSWVVDFAPCGRCGSLEIASGRLDTDPATVAARAVCTGCGARLVGIADPESPGRLVWSQQPDVAEGIA